MPAILIVEKNGNIKETVVKNYLDAELYKKAGLKNADGFAQHASWSADINGKQYTVQLYGKTEGKANQENKYEFPPPVDSVLFFGSCILVNVLNNVVVDLKEKEWEQIYEFLYGGFGELDSDEEEDEDDDEDDDLPKTKEGYAKDGFIVEDIDSDDAETDESEEEYKPPPKKKKPAAKPVAKQVTEKPVAKTVKAVKASKKVEPAMDNNYMDCASELMAEEYLLQEPTVPCTNLPLQRKPPVSPNI